MVGSSRRREDVLISLNQALSGCARCSGIRLKPRPLRPLRRRHSHIRRTVLGVCRYLWSCSFRFTPSTRCYIDKRLRDPYALGYYFRLKPVTENRVGTY